MVRSFSKKGQGKSGGHGRGRDGSGGQRGGPGPRTGDRKK